MAYDTVTFSDWKIRPSGSYAGPKGPTNTSVPMLVIGNTADPVTPWPGANETAMSLFPGSGLLTYNTTGVSLVLLSTARRSY